MRSRVVALLVAAFLLAAPAPALAASADDVFPGVPLPASPVHGTLTPGSDAADIYSRPLAAGDELTLSLVGGGGTDFSLALFNETHGFDEGSEIFWFWQPGYPKETSYVVPDSEAATYCVEIRSMDPSAGVGDYSLTWTWRHEKVARIYGADRYQTAAAVSRSTFVTATTAIIASGENYPDALAAAGLAGTLRAPVLLTRRDALSETVRRELQRLGVRHIKIIGSNLVVSDTVAQELAAMLARGGNDYDVERIAGSTRFDTARRVAERVKALGGSSECFLVSGRNYADALSVSPIAYARKMPVLLTDPARLSPEAADELTSLNSTHVIIAGSTAAVSGIAETVAARRIAANAARLTPGNPVSLIERWQGPTRFTTSIAVAQHAVGLGWASWGQVGLATGWNFPDALGGGAALGERGGVLLLSDPVALTPAIQSELQARKASVQRVYLFGSARALSEAVRSVALSAVQ